MHLSVRRGRGSPLKVMILPPSLTFPSLLFIYPDLKLHEYWYKNAILSKRPLVAIFSRILWIYFSQKWVSSWTLIFLNNNSMFCIQNSIIVAISLCEFLLSPHPLHPSLPLLRAMRSLLEKMTTSVIYFRGNDNLMKILEISPTSVFFFRGNDNLAIRE